MYHNPLITVAIPVYNCEKTIQKTIKSVLAQSLSDFELLICDDGSTDDTLLLIEAFKDPRIVIFRDGGNKGIATRLNQLINAAKGRYFARMDGDDVMFPNRLEKQVTFLQEHPEIDVVGASAVVMDESDLVYGIRGGSVREWHMDDLLMSARFIHPTVAGKTDWFKTWRYDENLSGCEDMDLWIRSFKASRFADIHEPLLFYRESLTFRLSTYLKRQRLLLKYAWSHLGLMDHRGRMLIITCKIVLSSIAAILLHMLKCDGKMIRRRNQELSSEAITKYQALLRQSMGNTI